MCLYICFCGICTILVSQVNIQNPDSNSKKQIDFEFRVLHTCSISPFHISHCHFPNFSIIVDKSHWMVKFSRSFLIPLNCDCAALLIGIQFHSSGIANVPVRNEIEQRTQIGEIEGWLIDSSSGIFRKSFQIERFSHMFRDTVQMYFIGMAFNPSTK